MTTFTAHLRAGRPPVLVPERFSCGALLFGPLWLLAHRAWVAAAVVFLLDLLATRCPEPAWRPALSIALAVLTGVFGEDLRRWSLSLRGFATVHVVAARDQDEAFARLLAAQPLLAEAAWR